MPRAQHVRCNVRATTPLIPPRARPPSRGRNPPAVTLRKAPFGENQRALCRPKKTARAPEKTRRSEPAVFARRDLFSYVLLEVLSNKTPSAVRNRNGRAELKAVAG